MYFKFYIFKFDFIIKIFLYFFIDCFLYYMCVLYIIYIYDNELVVFVFYFNVLVLMI